MHKFLTSIIGRILTLEGVLNCAMNICLTWDVTQNELEFKCRMNLMKFSVSFEDPRHTEQAHCLQPLPVSQCFKNYKNVTIYQNIAQRLTVLKIKGQIDESINGRWTCKHGSASDEAFVNVTVLQKVSYRPVPFTSGNICWQLYVCWSLLGYVPTFVCIRIIIVMLKLLNICQAKIKLDILENKVYSWSLRCIPKYAQNKKTDYAKSVFQFYQHDHDENKPIISKKDIRYFDQLGQQVLIATGIRGEMGSRRLFHLLVTCALIGIPATVGQFTKDVCIEYHGFTLLGVLLALVSTVSFVSEQEKGNDAQNGPPIGESIPLRDEVRVELENPN